MAPSMLKAPSILRQSVKDQQKPAEEGHFPVAMWLRLEELGLVRRWSITLSRKPDTGRYGLGLNEGNEVTVAPEGSGLMLADIIIGCEGERLGVKRLEDHLLHHGEPTIELEVIRALCPTEELRRRASSLSIAPREPPPTEGECSPATVVAERKWWHRKREPLGRSLLNESDDVDGTPDAAGRAGVAWYDESGVAAAPTPTADLQQSLARVRLTECED